MRVSLALVLSVGLIGCPAPAEEVDAAVQPDAFASMEEDAASVDEDAFRTRADATVSPGADAPLADAFSPTIDAHMASDAFTGPDAPAPGCACQTGDICQEASAPNCPALLSTCTGTRPTSCPRDHVLYTCDGRLGGTTYYARYFFDDYAAQARSCEMGGGTFAAATPPEPEGDACACQRTASGCVEVYGPSACSVLACTAPATRIAGECPSAGAVAGECVTFDGQRRISYYGISSAAAQMNCRSLSSGDYYWVPST